ncbi:hypothetical protein K470DRAFT_270216 [Piedraia hortae CBS 480.64]|uniref:WD40 repeat-like protein n=1 Tax=Piedraia hortae CBS 480.64 TaxID=1314780 RepID=A0A6A7C0K3_9PEZI|nr:hypothetical protein K470DRAFT_270216 [Piedraia hortae CBS 480.64]
MACQMMQFAPVLDVVTNLKPEALSLPWAGVRSLLMVAQKVYEHSESLMKGIETALDTSYLINAYFDIYSQFNDTATVRHLYDNIVRLYSLILKFLAHAHNTCDMNSMERMVHSLTGVVIPSFKTDHDEILKTVESHAKLCNLEVSEEQRAWVDKQLEALNKAQKEINDGVKSVQRTLDLNALPVAPGAAYDSIDYHNGDQIGELQLCLDGTRVHIKQRILDWATTSNDQRVFWLSGKAGTGKSTIARTIAHELGEQGFLVGSFFFKRDRGELSRARSLFPTITRQMANFIPSIAHKIAAASHGSPPVNERPLTSQFDTLIKEPLSGYSTGLATDVRVIVIDALDECEDWRAIDHAMTLWPRLIAHTSMNLRVFVTSRSDDKIGSKLGQLGPHDLQHEKLESLQTSTIKKDLTIYCLDELRKLREESKHELSYDELGDSWPGEEVVNKLVEISHPLFIAASTIFRDISNSPRRRVRQWVDQLSFTGSRALTEIYLDILNRAARHNEEWADQFHQVIKPIALLHFPLTIPALTDLLGDGDNMAVPNALKPLSSVIEFPSGKDLKAGSRATVRIYHESFRASLVDPTLKGKSPFWIEKGETHATLLNKCIGLLKNKLSRDVCKQQDLGTERKFVSVEHVSEHIPESVQYACRNWVHHVVHSSQTIQDGGQVDRFLREFFLVWTEAMAWLDELGEMVLSLKQLQKVIDTNFSRGVQYFVADALRWISAHRILISDTPLQTYLSALAFAPSNSTVRNTFKHEVEALLQVWPPVTRDWGPVLQTLKGHTRWVSVIAPSMDGKRLLTTALDKTVRLWDVESGTEEELMEFNSECTFSVPTEEGFAIIAELRGGYSRWRLEEDVRRIDLKLPGVAKCVSVSPSGRFAAWGLDMGGTYLWDGDIEAGELLEVQPSPVRCMAFSSDNETLVSGSSDIWKWNAKSGHKKICHVDADIYHLAISPNNVYVVFWSNGALRVFCHITQEIDQIMRVALGGLHFSTVTPDSQKVLFSNEQDLFLYDFGTRSAPTKLSLTGYSLMELIFSPDGRTIWAGDILGSVIQMDAELVMKSQQQGTGTATVAMSADGKTLASLSRYNQLSLWNTEAQICKQRLSDERLVNFPASRSLLLISSDCSLVVVACLNYTPGNALMIWNIKLNELRGLRHKADNISAIVIAPDSKTLLCGLHNGQIWIYDLKGGVRQKIVDAHTDRIREIVFHPEGQGFASLSNDKTIKIWTPRSQTPLVLSDKLWVHRACFSADGHMLYTLHNSIVVSEWDIKRTCKVRELDKKIKYDCSGSLFLNGSFVHANFLHFLHMLDADKGNQVETQADMSGSTEAPSVFGNRQVWALQSFRYDQVWITVNGRKMLKLPVQLIQVNWVSCGRTMAIPNNETGFTVLNFTRKVSL